jgi:thiol-disulfide isomerase/thioredoxin
VHSIRHLSLGVLLVLRLASDPSGTAEARVVEYLKAHVRRGEAVRVSQLYNEVFTAPEERAALNRLFDTFFRVPLFAAQYQQATGRPPSLRDISDRFRLPVPGEAALLLDLAESDPRVPRFLTRDGATGEIRSVDVQAVLASPQFGREIQRSIGGLEGRPAPGFSLTTFGGQTLASDSLRGAPFVLYFWFSGCPPCVKTAPLLVQLDQEFRGTGLKVIGVNADRVLELPETDASRAQYAAREGIRFTLVHMTPAVQQDYGNVEVFPTLVFVDKAGVVVKELVSFHPLPDLEAAARQAVGRP